MLHQLPLSRTSLLSLATIVSTITLFATGATYAVWSGSGSASGTVTATAVNIFVEGSPGPGLSFASGAGCSGAMSQGEVCIESVKVTNNGTSTVTLTSPPTAVVTSVTDSVSPSGCTNVATNWSVAADALSNTTLNPGQNTTFDVTVTLGLSAHNGCQGETATITVTVNAIEVV
jgi:hypothetical protein